MTDAQPSSTIAAHAYILVVPSARRKILLNAVEGEYSYYSTRPFASEPVENFEHSRRAPLVVFAAFEDNCLTHVADGQKGQSAGTGLVKLKLTDLVPLSRPVSFEEVLAGIPRRVRQHVGKALKNGGILPPKSLIALVDRVLELDPSLRRRLSRFSTRRRQVIARLHRQERTNLAYQKESLGLALQIGGFSRAELLEWEPDEDQQSFLDGLPGAHVREDSMLIHDLGVLPGFEAIDEASHVASKRFIDPEHAERRMTVVMANRTRLEEQTGADLIYYNETYQSFVMVQYKAMEGSEDGAEFRWQDGDQFMIELSRMEKILDDLRKVPPHSHPDGYRFTENPFFLKFCPKVIFNPDDKGLFKGIYLPLDLWKLSESDGRFKGPKGGSVITFENAGRRINNTEFVSLVANAWVGTNIPQSALLTPLIRMLVAEKKTVILAVKHKEKTEVTVDVDYDDEELDE